VDIIRTCVLTWRESRCEPLLLVALTFLASALRL